MKLKFEAEKCTGCRACEMACIDQSDIACTHGQNHLCRVIERNGVPYVKNCIHCGKCTDVCPTGCLYQAENGLILANTDLCVGCGACEAACPVRVISYDPDTGKVKKCDLCIGRMEAGLLPACVHTCPTGALSIID